MPATAVNSFFGVYWANIAPANGARQIVQRCNSLSYYYYRERYPLQEIAKRRKFSTDDSDGLTDRLSKLLYCNGEKLNSPREEIQGMPESGVAPQTYAIL